MNSSERFCRRCAEFFANGVASRNIDIVHRSKFSRRNFGIEPRVIASDMANANNTNAEFFYRHKIPSTRHIFQKPIVGCRDTVAKRNRRLPAKATQFGDIEKFSRRAVRLGRVPGEFAIKTDDITNQLS